VKRRSSHFFIAAAIFAVFVEIFSLGRAVRGVPAEAFDFRQLYAAGYIVRSGRGASLYNLEFQKQIEDRVVSQHEGALPFNHLAFEAGLFAPLATTRFDLAYKLMMVANVATLIACYFIMRDRFGPLREFWRFLPEAIFLSFLPFAVTIFQGQDSILLALIFAISATVHERDEFLSGIVLAAGLFKFQFVLPVAVLFFFWKRRRFVNGFAMGAAVVLLISLAIAGPALVEEYPRSLVSMSTGLTESGQQIYGIRPQDMTNIRGFVSAIASSHFAVVATLVMVSGAVLVWAVRQRASFALASAAAVAISIHCLQHDLSILVVPAVLTLSTKSIGQDKRLLAAGALIVPSIVYGFGIPLWADLAASVLILAANARMNHQARDFAVA